MKPFLKWAGGKTQILEKVLETFPRSVDCYFEPFLGGGSVLLGFLQSGISYNKICASDINPALIGLYKNIQEFPDDLIYHLKNLAISNAEEYYYEIRNRFNNFEDKQCVVASAMFLFLNKTCFRGLFREGPHGFNVPFGHYKNPSIFDEDHIFAISKLIQPVQFTCCSYEIALENVSNNDFVYLDPPYVPIKSDSFVKYNKLGFNSPKLFEFCNSIPRFVMSNADVPIVREFAKDKKVLTLSCRRAIHSKEPSTRTNEVLIQSFN